MVVEELEVVGIVMRLCEWWNFGQRERRRRIRWHCYILRINYIKEEVCKPNLIKNRNDCNLKVGYVVEVLTEVTMKHNLLENS